MSRRNRVLVVEDDESLREAIAEVVADDGHEVRTATDGHHGLVESERWNPDLIILDVIMPRMDAYEFRRRQRSSTDPHRAALLVMSAAADLATAAGDLHADGWLAKPFTVDALTAMVAELLRRRRDAPEPGHANGAVDRSAP
jgi:two-component system response regulator MprA